MKNNSIKTILGLLLGVGPAFAQTSASLDTNNISAKFFANGKLFDGFFEVPKGSGKNSIFAGNIWIGGKVTAGQLHLAAQTYGQSGSDFFFGPIASSYQNPPFIIAYNKVSHHCLAYHCLAHD